MNDKELKKMIMGKPVPRNAFTKAYEKCVKRREKLFKKYKKQEEIYKTKIFNMWLFDEYQKYLNKEKTNEKK